MRSFCTRLPVIQKLRIQCPTCRTRLRAPVQLLGQTRDCPRCGVAFVVSRPERAGEKTTLRLDESTGTVLISQRDTIDQRLEWGEIRPGQASSAEKLDAEGVRVRNLVAQFVRTMGSADGRPIT